MAGVYIHIPFCRKKCVYCNFFSLATTRFRDDFHRALLKEIEITSGYLGNEPVETVYFGGGTPSLLEVNQIAEILKGCTPPPAPPLKGRGESGLFHPAPEITLELNPDDVTGEYLNGLFETGVNRLSIGIQSFFNEDLEYLGRSHDVRQAEKLFHGSWLMAHGSSSRNVSVDFIYGIPTLTDNRWRTNLQRAIDAGVPHISAYALTVEPKTPLDWMIRRYPTPSPSPEGERSIQLSSHPVIQSSRLRYPVSDDQSARQFEILMDTMEDHGYIQYEISNFCLPGFESIHNSNYWKGIPYLGLGPSAHSFNGSSRRWNVPNLTSYIRHLSSGTLPCEGEEHLTITRHYNEYVMTSLRTVRGCNLSVIAEQFGDAYADHFRSLAQRYINSGHLTGNQGVYTLSRNGKFLADGISAELFMEES